MHLRCVINLLSRYNKCIICIVSSLYIRYKFLQRKYDIKHSSLNYKILKTKGVTLNYNNMNKLNCKLKKICKDCSFQDTISNS